jgi:hypothetical protein
MILIWFHKPCRFFSYKFNQTQKKELTLEIDLFNVGLSAKQVNGQTVI